MKYLLILIPLAVVVFFFNPHASETRASNTGSSTDSAAISLDLHVQKMVAFTAKHKAYNKQIAFFADMRRPSGNFRFFVVNLSTKKVLYKGLVAHGVNSEKNAQGIMTFSNQPDSYCSSLGMYSVGASYNGRFGNAYKLYGLDSSNSNAFSRFIVLHSYYCVPDAEQAEPICNSLGCPMVSNAFIKQLEKMIDTSSKPLAMEMYY